MKIQQFLEHYGIGINPFSQEDAQSDHIFRQHCSESLYHAAWDKILGDCSNPSTSIVFGEKGAGKTAIRLQLINSLREHNRRHPEERAFIISYDDLNPFLDNFQDRLRGRRRHPDHALQEWRLWDHMDALLALSTRRLCNVIADPNASDPDIHLKQLCELPRMRKRDLLMLAAFYDQSSDQSHWSRWSRIRKNIGFLNITARWRFAVGIFVSLLVLAFALRNISRDGISVVENFVSPWFLLALFAGWFPWLKRSASLWWKARQIAKQVRILEHGTASLHQILSSFPAGEIDGQPMPSRDRSDDRYELMSKLQRILKPLGFTSIFVLVDRVDEPHLINGSAQRMRDFLWSMFDNKFLKHPGIGFKMLLPRDVVYFLNREEREFYERSRLDKQNLIKSLEWTGESLFDMATNRIRACMKGDAERQDHNNGVTIASLFADDVTREDLISRFGRLRVPRHLFRFLYRLLTEHCNRFTEDEPSWKIGRSTLETTMEAYSRELDAFDRGLGTG
ncbi:MAG: hypothetical protein KDA91_01685 [Planctomycetaceae bacterium]|nr:hypothetical protein [Planctomycetaceae bacterium]